MRPFLLLPCVLLSTSLCAFCSVDAGLLALVPAGSKVVAAIDVTNSRNSELGQYLLAKSQEAVQGQEFQKMMQDTGFDPRRDLQSVMFASGEPAGPRPSFAILARGTFDESRNKAHAQAHGAVVESYQGVEIILNKYHNDQTACAFFDVGVAAIGDLATVRQMIANRASPSVLPAALRGKVESLGSGNDLWFAALMTGDFLAKHFGAEAADPQATPQQGMPQQAKVLQSIMQSSGGIRLGSMIDITFHAITRSPQDANALADVIHFLASLVQMQRQNDHRADLVASSLDNMIVQTEGDAVHFSLSVPEKKFEQLADLAPKPSDRLHAKPNIQ